jgi:hypothetical protein
LVQPEKLCFGGFSSMMHVWTKEIPVTTLYLYLTYNDFE